MHIRLKELRHDLSLSQKEFGQKIGFSQNHIASLESGVRTLTDRTINDICRVFCVNEVWLRSGNLPMYTDPFNGLSIDEDVKQIAFQYNKLRDKDKQLVKELIDSLLNKD